MEEKAYSYFKNINRRVLKINEKSVPIKKFFIENAATIFNPEKIEILMIFRVKGGSFWMRYFLLWIMNM